MKGRSMQGTLRLLLGILLGTVGMVGVLAAAKTADPVWRDLALGVAVTHYFMIFLLIRQALPKGGH